MGRRQFRVLYREFLFRFVDRELLSSHATGDMSQLLLQVTTLLLVLSILFSAPALILDFGEPVVVRMLFTLSIEHFLIATTMLAVGLFAVFSWGSMFPSHQDVLVLGPLPVRAEMILLAKLAGVATVLGLVIFALHVVAGVVWPLVLYANDRAPLEPGAAWPLPFASAPRSWLRLFAAYWITMCAAGMFVFGTAMGVQGLAAALLPHRHFLRVSSLLQLTAFGVIIGTYFLQPMLVRPTTFYRVPASPSYWFLGLFQTLSGSTVFAPLARSAYMGLAVALAVAALAYALSYVRTLRRIAEQPDISPGVRRLRWLPAVGGQSQTAIVHFSLRTLARSAQHRVILAFYWGIGFALAAFAVKLPRPRRVAVDAVPNGWPENSLALLVSSLIMLGFTVLGARVAFALPRDVQATWIFRILPIRDALEYARPRRRALLLISVAPVWIATAIVFFSTWPWMPAAGHLAALAVAGAILTEVAVAGTATIPFTCSYLPGKSQFHIIAFLGLVLVLPLTFSAARFERDALQDGIAYAKMMGVLALTWIVVRYRTAWLEKAQGSQIEFDGKPADTPLTLGVWDSRF